jgi:hypothetical protein
MACYNKGITLTRRHDSSMRLLVGIPRQENEETEHEFGCQPLRKKKACSEVVEEL